MWEKYSLILVFLVQPLSHAIEKRRKFCLGSLFLLNDVASPASLLHSRCFITWSQSAFSSLSITTILQVCVSVTLTIIYTCTFLPDPFVRTEEHPLSSTPHTLTQGKVPRAGRPPYALLCICPSLQPGTEHGS